MKTCDKPVHRHRYAVVTAEKAAGATYTPKQLADFVAEGIVENLENLPLTRPLRVLDPAVGDGELLVSLLKKLSSRCDASIEVHGFELDQDAIDLSMSRISHLFPEVSLSFEAQSFLEYVVSNFGVDGGGGLFRQKTPETFDIIIANPPYVRTQIMGTHQAQDLAKQFNLSGRVDLYYAFIVAMAQVLNPHGVAGIIVSNRFMTTRSGAAVRQALRQRFNLRHIWDLGDTKLFNAAVLPAVLVVGGKNTHGQSIPGFTSIYETTEIALVKALTPIQALSRSGIVRVEDGRRFLVQHGVLDTSGTEAGVWRVATKTAETWLATVGKHTWGTFRDIGKIRVGVKTCADKVFIRSDWQDLPDDEQPELLRPLVTHHVARRFRGLVQDKPQQILYAHEIVEGTRRAIELSRYPRSRAYLERHRARLEARKYVIQAGRKWYEIWVPQDPAAWGETKLVFRDIADAPTFWIDQDGSVVNGDCYWIICDRPLQADLLWLAAAVGNSSFIERFYDYSFQNKLYAGRRRFITQYVERFPLPNPQNSLGQKIIAKAKEIYDCTPSQRAETLQVDLDQMIWKAFGLGVEEVGR